jgi:cysteinyl-tRNA synthetase
VEIWMHGGMVRLDGEKMSKSLGNLVLVRNLLADYSADAVRILLLSHHYRESWEYTVEQMRAVQAVADRLTGAAALAGDAVAVDEDVATRQAQVELEAALEDDFHTEWALEALERLAERALTSGSTRSAGKLRELASVLGLCLPPAAAPEAAAAAGQQCEG